MRVQRALGAQAEQTQEGGNWTSGSERGVGVLLVGKQSSQYPEKIVSILRSLADFANSDMNRIALWSRWQNIQVTIVVA